MADLLTDIEAFCKRHSMTETDFGESALNDRALVHAIRGKYGRPRRLWPETEAKVRDFMAEYSRGNSLAPCCYKAEISHS